MDKETKNSATPKTKELFEKGNYRKKEKHNKIENNETHIEKAKEKKKLSLSKIIVWVIVLALLGSSVLTSFVMFM